MQSLQLDIFLAFEGRQPHLHSKKSLLYANSIPRFYFSPTFCFGGRREREKRQRKKSCKRRRRRNGPFAYTQKKRWRKKKNLGCPFRKKCIWGRRGGVCRNQPKEPAVHFGNQNNSRWRMGRWCVSGEWRK